MNWLAIGSAFWLGILTAISPCPLTTNIAAISSAPSSSKSSGTLPSPVRKPIRRAGASASTRTKRATGFPAFAITTDSPAATASSSRDRCVFAS